MIPILALMILALTANSLHAQVQIPTFLGLWCPRSHSIATYQVEEEFGEVEAISLAVLSMAATRVEISTTYFGLDRHRVVQVFDKGTTKDDYRLASVRVEEPGLTPRDLPRNLWRGGDRPLLAAALGQKISADEKVVVPAGTFQCTHYRIKDAEVWLSPQVSPYGIVRYKAPGLELRLNSYREDFQGSPADKH